MRKLLISILAFCILFLSACDSLRSLNDNSYNLDDITYLEDGSYYYSSVGHTSYVIKNLPFDLDVENKAVPLCNVRFFEIYENHGYTAYLIVTLGRENLTNDDIHWITKYDDNKHGKTLDVNVYTDSVPNNLDSEPLNFMGGTYGDSYMHYVFSSNLYRYSFKDSLFSIQVVVSPSGITANDTVYYHYDHHIDEEAYSDSTASLTGSERFALKHSGYSGPFNDNNIAKEYPGETGIPIGDALESIPSEIYLQTGEENGLIGTKYFVQGTVTEIGKNDSANYFIVNTSMGDVLISDMSETAAMHSGSLKVDVEQLQFYYPIPKTGEYIKVLAEYQGMSGKMDMPLFLYGTTDYLYTALALSIDNS